jgi:hypothetical protein
MNRRLHLIGWSQLVHGNADADSVKVSIREAHRGGAVGGVNQPARITRVGEVLQDALEDTKLFASEGRIGIGGGEVREDAAEGDSGQCR